MFHGFLDESIIKRAISNHQINVELVNFRDYSKDKNFRVDEYQYGGGAGMVIQLQPVVDCLKDIKQKDSYVILLSPQGKPYNQQLARKLSNQKHLILIAGHYEGFDERITNYVDETISVGDYVLTGGELPAMILIDSITRLLPNTITNESLSSESFDNYLLDYPTYTKPLDFEGYKVPEILLSGNHQEIDKYRKIQQEIKTKKIRPDLYKKYLKGKKEVK